MTTLRELSVKYPDLLIGQKKETNADLLAVEAALCVRCQRMLSGTCWNADTAP